MKLKGGNNITLWWGRGDSNPHAFRHVNLNHARLPIPTLPRGVQRQVDAELRPLSSSLAVRVEVPTSFVLNLVGHQGLEP